MIKDLPEDGTIEAGLFLLELISGRGIEWTLDEIAVVCGKKRQSIWAIEQRAMRKIRRELERRGINEQTI